MIERYKCVFELYLKEKIDNYEQEEQLTFRELYHLNESVYKRPEIDVFSYYAYLYHGIRYTPLTTIESIFQDKEIRCGKKVKKELLSYDNTCKSIIIGDFGSENCNKGEYVSVTPYEELDIFSPSIESQEFNNFIRENPFFIIKGCIDARETFYISYEEYNILRKSRVKTKNLYSYAHSEYLVMDHISLDDVVAIGIDYRFISKNNYYLIDAIINLMRIYQIQIPFIDISSNRIIFELEKDLEQSDEVSSHKK